MTPVRGQVYLMTLGPSVGKEIKKTRPCVVLSPDDLNESLSTVIVAPLTTGGHPYPMRIPCTFRKRRGFVVLDQLRTVDVDRLVRRLGRLSSPTLGKCLTALREMFLP
jgi:mRNA interferase MazF